MEIYSQLVEYLDNKKGLLILGGLFQFFQLLKRQFIPDYGHPSAHVVT